MYPKINNFKMDLIVVSIFALTLKTALSANFQMTNSIPTNVFVTDDGKLFWRKSDQRVIDFKKIKEAQTSPESKPASEDVAGHWGEVTNGLQLSLRFQKSVFTNGETIIATMLMRNVTNISETYWRPTHVYATKNGKVLKRKDDTGIIQITMTPEVNIFPQTQHMYKENLNGIFDLSENGEYIFHAASIGSNVLSGQVSIIITNSVQ